MIAYIISLKKIVILSFVIVFGIFENIHFEFKYNFDKVCLFNL